MIEEEFGGKMKKGIGDDREIRVILKNLIHIPSPEETKTIRPVSRKVGITAAVI